MRITAKLQLDKIRKPKDLFKKLNMLNMRKCEKIEKRLGELKREVKFVNQSFLTKSGTITDNLLNEAEVTFKIGKELDLGGLQNSNPKAVKDCCFESELSSLRANIKILQNQCYLTMFLEKFVKTAVTEEHMAICCQVKSQIRGKFQNKKNI
jgi:hypothetical protein